MPATKKAVDSASSNTSALEIKNRLNTMPDHVIFYAPSQANIKPEPIEPISFHSLFRDRSIEETEAAHDLLSLSQSLPPLPAPCVVTIFKDEKSSQYAASSAPVMQEICKPTNTTNIKQEGVIVETKFSSIPKSRWCSYENNEENCSPLTPPTSEYSSDLEVEVSSSSSSDASNHSNIITKIPQNDIWNSEAKNVNNTKILIADGRSKNRKFKDNKEDNLRIPKLRKGNYKCSECGKEYATSSNLSRHKQTHRSLDSQSAKKCNVCGKAYVSMPALSMHILTHKLTHSCDICGKCFSRPWLLQGHLRSHTGEKPYACIHCNKAFADRSNLRAHMQTHSVDKNFECHRCHKTFALKSYLNKHLESACQKEKDQMHSSDENEEDIVVI